MKRLLINVPVTSNANQRKERIFNFITYSLVVLVLLSGVPLLWEIIERGSGNADENVNQKFSLDLSEIHEVVLSADADESRPRNPSCRFWNCLNLYRCGQNELDRLTVYVYPFQDFVDGDSGKSAFTLSREYYEILEATVQSSYYTSNPNEACLFLVSIDMLNQNLIDQNLINRALASLDYWDDGKNHLIFNMIPGTFPTFNTTIDVNTDKALIMGGGFNTWSYRAGFDVAMPVWSIALRGFHPSKLAVDFQRKYKLVVAQLNLFPKQLRIIQAMAEDHSSDILLLRHCSDTRLTGNGNVRCSSGARQYKYEYPHALNKGSFCLLSRSLRLGQPDLLEMLAYNCIPVIAIDNYILPFEDVLDWSLFSVRIREADLHSLMERLNAISHVKILELQEHGRWIFGRYFKDLRTITLTTLEILENRVFPHRARSIQSWNTIDTNYRRAVNPLFLPVIAPKSQGFTAVILTYDRVESLFLLIQKLALVPSLQSIVVIWNNQRKLPPHLSSYPTIPKPLKVIQTRANRLSNRFFPYAEIETEAILTIDDDIVMLTADELDFGYEVWREFPDRIVGFPSRIHVWDNSTMKWHYESEWTNQISMVLTGAAFHHKFWSHMYTYAMPGDIKEWVDEHMNCEDIAMNFLVANITNKAPIKVTPRKKFKCPECTNTEMLSADLNHMRERSACIDRFARIYGRMPLRSVEFRADPVLFKDNFPEKLKRFNDVGIL